MFLVLHDNFKHECSAWFHKACLAPILSAYPSVYIQMGTCFLVLDVVPLKHSSQLWSTSDLV